MDNTKIEIFCKKFASYVTRNWKDNHLHIYVDVNDGEPKIACYGLGKVNWSGNSHPDYPFHNALVELVQSFPASRKQLSVEFFCGKVCKAEIN